MASITHGSARFATYKEVKRAGLFGDEGIVLGTLGRHYVGMPVSSMSRWWEAREAAKAWG